MSRDGTHSHELFHLLLLHSGLQLTLLGCIESKGLKCVSDCVCRWRHTDDKKQREERIRDVSPIHNEGLKENDTGLRLKRIMQVNGLVLVKL